MAGSCPRGRQVTTRVTGSHLDSGVYGDRSCLRVHEAGERSHLADASSGPSNGPRIREQKNSKVSDG